MGLICAAVTWSLRNQMGGFAGSKAMRRLYRRQGERQRPVPSRGDEPALVGVVRIEVGIKMGCGAWNLCKNGRSLCEAIAQL